MATFTFWLVFLVLPFGLFMLARNEMTYHVRGKFLKRPVNRWHEGYDLLPEYSDMMTSPRYYLLWTERQWDAWIAQQTSSKH